MMHPNDQKRPFHEGGKVGRKNATLIKLMVLYMTQFFAIQFS